VFQSDLRLLPLCDTQRWRGLNGDDLVKLYDDTVTVLLDRQVPVCTVTCHRRPSDGWFDDECRHAKRRHLGPLSDRQSPAVQTWRTERRQLYFALVRRKRAHFWTERIDADQQQPRRLWQSFDQLLGRGRVPPTDIEASVLHDFFDAKVAGVWSATTGADPACFTAAPVGCKHRLFTTITPVQLK